MSCVACGHGNPEHARFCLECGAPMARSCASCGVELPPAARFCLACGAAVSGVPAKQRGEAPPPQRSPAAYTPKHLAEKILASKFALEGERKQVTVLFADVKGSMDLAESIDAEDWHTILERFFAILTDGVHRFEGTVNQYTGDGIMALFGAPIAHEDHAQRACYAALHMRDALRELAREVKRRHGIEFATRIGINSGEVVVGKIGDDLRMDYTAQGHTVGLAQRMESLASGGSIYLGANTAALARGYFALEDLGEFEVKGAAEPLRVFELQGTGTARTHFDLSRARGLTHFIGRAADLRTLEDALEQTAAGNGQVVGVVAEAGTGKSRLCFEFLERCRARGMRVYEGHAVAHGRNIPFLPILEVFRAYFGIAADDDARSAREKIAGRMVVLDQGFADALPLVFDFLGVSDPERPAPRLDAEVRQRQLIGLMRQLIQSAAQPTVTMIEDLHWLDASSAAFLEQMVDARAGSRSLLLLNFRPEYHAEWMQKSWYRQIPLAPLGRESIADLLADLLGSDPSIARLAGAIHARTGGNPFFTEEVVQSLIESRHLEGTRGAHRLVTPIDRLDVPATVQAVLAARIDRLPEREKRLLQVASVIGKEFSEPLLAAAAGLPADELKAALAALQRAEFIHEQALYPVAEYAFKHPLTQEVALASQLRERRCGVHAALALAIEQQDAEHLDERAALLAHHSEEAGEALNAARWHRRAAKWAERNDFSAAVHHWGRVRALVCDLPDDREAAALGITACTRLLLSTNQFGIELDQARALLEEGQALANAIGDRRAHIYLSLTFLRALNAAGDTAAQLELAIECQRVALDLADIRVQAAASMRLAEALWGVGRLSDALQVAEEGLARFPRSIVGLTIHGAFSLFRGLSLGSMGRLPESLEEIGRSRRLFEEDGALDLVCFALSGAAEGYYRTNDPDGALTSARQLDEISGGAGEPRVLVAFTQSAFAFAHLAAGRPAEAIEAARAALEILGRVLKANADGVTTRLAEALLQTDDLSAAESTATAAIALCQRSLRGDIEAEAHGVMARALLRRDGPAACDAVEAELASAAELIERTGAKTLAPFLCEWRAELAAVLGDDATRDQLLRQAERLYEEIGAPLHAARLAADRQERPL